MGENTSWEPIASAPRHIDTWIEVRVRRTKAIVHWVRAREVGGHTDDAGWCAEDGLWLTFRPAEWRPA